MSSNPPPSAGGWMPIDTVMRTKKALVAVAGTSCMAPARLSARGNSWHNLIDGARLPWQPTHWMPLPPPPTEER